MDKKTAPWYSFFPQFVFVDSLVFYLKCVYMRIHKQME